MLALAAWVLCSSSEARAEVTLRPTLDGILVVVDGEPTGGGQLGVVLGYNLEQEPFIIMPELAAGAAIYDGGFGFRALGGVRGGFAGPVEPSLFLRGGYGNLIVTRGDSSNLVHGGVFQPGLALDYRFSRSVTLGAEAYYDLFVFSVQQTTSLAHTVGVGGNAAFWF